MLQRDKAKGLTPADARSRLAAQMPLSDKLAYADTVLDNAIDATESSPPRLRAEVGRLIARWRRESHGLVFRALWLLCWLLPPFGLLWGLVVVAYRARARAARLSKMKSAIS